MAKPVQMMQLLQLHTRGLLLPPKRGDPPRYAPLQILAPQTAKAAPRQAKEA